MRFSEEHGYFASNQDFCYSTAYLPSEQTGANCVMLPPFGEERKSSTRLFVLLARALARQGHTVLRFDFTGTGESGGKHSQATLTGWLQQAETALQLLSHHNDEKEWFGIGARLGANILLRLALEKPPEQIILLEPLLNGDDYLRDLQRRQQIKNIMSSSEKTAEFADLWENSQSADLAGYEIGPIMASEIAEIRLAIDLKELESNCKMLLLHISGARDFSGPWKEIAQQLHEQKNAYAAIVREKPFWGQLAYHESELVMEKVLDHIHPNAVS